LPHLDFQSYFRSLRPASNPRNPWFPKFWEQTFKCRLLGFPHPLNRSGHVTSPSTPCDVDNQFLSPSLFRQDPLVPATIEAVDRAVFAIAEAVRRQVKRDPVTTILNDGNCVDWQEPYEILMNKN
jgi:hypothetical protein